MNQMTSQITDLMSRANNARFADPDQSHGLYLRAVELSRDAGYQLELIQALKGLGQLERDLNNVNAALTRYEEAVELCRQEGDRLLLAHTVRHVGDIHQDAGRNDLAEPCYNEALMIYRHHKETNTVDLANAIRPLALLKESLGKNEEAKRLFEEARDLYAACNIAEGVAEMSRRAARL
jgi:tetratricopeptide (TPR) repeat protein